MSRTSKRLKINGKIVDVVTISGLAEMVGKSRSTILRYHDTDVFPTAPILVSARNVRYYPMTLAERLVPLVSRIPLNEKIPAELIAEINGVFNEEKQKLCR